MGDISYTKDGKQTTKKRGKTRAVCQGDWDFVRWTNRGNKDNWNSTVETFKAMFPENQGWKFITELRDEFWMIPHSEESHATIEQFANIIETELNLGEMTFDFTNSEPRKDREAYFKRSKDPTYCILDWGTKQDDPEYFNTAKKCWDKYFGKEKTARDMPIVPYTLKNRVCWVGNGINYWQIPIDEDFLYRAIKFCREMEIEIDVEVEILYGSI